jgi:hypothetical protein
MALQGIAQRKRDVIEIERFLVRARVDELVAVSDQEAGNGAQPTTLVERVDQQGNRTLSVVDADGVDRRNAEGPRVSHRGVAADDDAGLGRHPANATGETEHVVDFQGVHASDTNDSRAVALEMELDRLREPQIENVNLVSPVDERAGDVLHSQRLDAKKRP